jgi:hypothetical protein
MTQSTPETSQSGTTFETPQLGAYLIIAHYDHNSWKKPLDRDKRQAVKDAAEELFPDEEGEIKEISDLEGVLFVRTFFSRFFNSIPAGLDTMEFEERLDEDWTRRNEAVARVLNNLPRGFSRTIGSPRQDIDLVEPGIGWMAVVEESYLPGFLERLEDEKLGKVYKNFQVIPLNDDQNTKHIYQRMTAVSWS